MRSDVIIDEILEKYGNEEHWLLLKLKKLQEFTIEEELKFSKKVGDGEK